MADGRSWSAKVRIYRAQHLADAQLVQDLLEQDGIPVETRGISLMGLAGGIPIADAMPTLWVVPHNVDRAQALIAALERWEGMVASGLERAAQGEVGPDET